MILRDICKLSPRLEVEISEYFSQFAVSYSYCDITPVCVGNFHHFDLYIKEDVYRFYIGFTINKSSRHTVYLFEYINSFSIISPLFKNIETICNSEDSRKSLLFFNGLLNTLATIRLKYNNPIEIILTSQNRLKYIDLTC